ncbi:MAG: hypothetical protein ACKOAV_04815 [Bacteroidota bacterium]
MRYVLTEDRRGHVLRHFGGSAASGSYFESSIFPDPDTLLALLEGMEPENQYQQGNGREAHVYRFLAGTVCGYIGLGKRRDYDNAEWDEELRNGFVIQFAWVDSLVPTHSLTVVCDVTALPYSIITAFPGDYAPAFPHQGMDEVEFAVAEDFWQEHILLKVKE